MLKPHNSTVPGSGRIGWELTPVFLLVAPACVHPKSITSQPLRPKRLSEGLALLRIGAMQDRQRGSWAHTVGISAGGFEEISSPSAAPILRAGLLRYSFLYSIRPPSGPSLETQPAPLPRNYQRKRGTPSLVPSRREWPSRICRALARPPRSRKSMDALRPFGIMKRRPR